MSSIFTSIPYETLCSIVSYLLLPDQAALARTCKALNGLVIPIVWRDIELHHSGTHEGINIELELEALRDYWEWGDHMAASLVDDPRYPYKKLIYEPSRRKYAQCHFKSSKWQKSFRPRLRREKKVRRDTDNDVRESFQFGREEEFVGVRKITSSERWAELAQHVRSVCLSIAIDDEVAETLATFSNLRSLELVGLPLEKGHPPIAPEMRFPRLQNLKLRGYFSAALVRSICNNAENIKYLDLGLLSTATDDEAYKPNLLADDDNRALVSEQEAENYQQNGSEAAFLAADGTSEIVIDDDPNGDKPNPLDVLPLASHAPIWLPRSLPARFTELTHLHLVKPYTGETNDYNWMLNEGFLHIPHQYEQVLCLEWVALLRGVGGTLRELILEHRIPVEQEGGGDPIDVSPRVKGGNRRGHSPFSSTNPDRGDELFCRSVLRLLVEENSRFPKLQRLAFRGIQIKGLRTRIGLDEVPGQNGVPNNDELLRELYPNCDIEIFEDVYPIIAYAGHLYHGWSEHRHEAIQDGGDGLMWSLYFYNNYKMKFGPQWHIAG
ncbi:hypothetical protein F5Y03DRAFT_322421 [Xylaria venustula]|nr:hypothetical protein F5Y03DRAFT_322421 [Xylaria venustula]